MNISLPSSTWRLGRSLLAVSVWCAFAAAPALAAHDGGAHDAGLDSGVVAPPADAGQDAGADAGFVATDAGPVGDAGVQPPMDAGVTEDAGTPPPPPDPVWTCDPSYFNAADGCDCECGIPNPDCDLANQQLYGCPAGTNSCSDDGYCEIPGCGNGVVNPETEACDDGNALAYDGCSPGCRPEAGWSCSADPTQCIPVPEGWEGSVGPYCSDGRYGDGLFCDCGCGVLDLDCLDETAVCDGLPLGCVPTTAVTDEGEVDFSLLQQVPDLLDNTRCIDNVCGDTWVAGTEECDDGNTDNGDLCDAQCEIETPAGWTCDPEFVLDDECDCGCGALDPACPAAALNPTTDCAFDECRGPQFVDPANHALCLDLEEEDPPADAGAADDDAGAVDEPAPDAGPGTAPACESRQVRTEAPAVSLLLLALGAMVGGRRRRRAGAVATEAPGDDRTV